MNPLLKLISQTDYYATVEGAHGFRMRLPKRLLTAAISGYVILHAEEFLVYIQAEAQK